MAGKKRVPHYTLRQHELVRMDYNMTPCFETCYDYIVSCVKMGRAVESIAPLLVELYSLRDNDVHTTLYIGLIEGIKNDGQ